MTILLVQHSTINSGNGGNPASNALSSSAVSGNTVFAFIMAQANSQFNFATVTDNLGNSYTLDGTAFESNGQFQVWIYRCSNIVGGAGLVVTASHSTNFWSTQVAEFSGLNASSPLDGSGSTNQQANSGLNVSTGAFSTTNTNDLLLLATGFNQHTVTPPTGFASFGTGAANLDAEYQIVATTQAGINPTWGNSGGAPSLWSAVGLAYKAASGGGGGSPVRNFLTLGVGG